MAQNRSSAYIFQGVMYFYRQEKICCRYEITLRDEVDPALLQAAQDEVLSRAEYFRQQLVWEKRDAYLEPNGQPCLVFQGSQLREIPEETNGYLFYFSCEGPVIYLNWHHFLSDGRGMASFAALVLEAYCNRRYGAGFVGMTLVTPPPYDEQALFDRFPSCHAKNDQSEQVPEIAEGAAHRTLVRVDKASLVQRALASGVKPFSCLTALLTLSMRQYLGRDEIFYSYSADTRDDIGAPGAPYNCVTSFQGRAAFGPDPRLEDFVGALDREVKSNLEPERKLERMAQQMNWIYEVSKLKAPLKIKQRVFQMGEYMGGVPSDFWISYLGNPLRPTSPELMDYIEDFEVWVPPDGASICVEAASVNGQIILCIQDKTLRSGLADVIRAVMEQEQVRVIQAQDRTPAFT